MAAEKITKRAGKYAVLELNQVAFPRDGRIEAQLPLKKYVASTGTDGFDKTNPAEVGMILVVDKAAGCIRKALSGELSGDNANDKLMFALHYSTEHLYDERAPRLDEFCMYPSDESYNWPNSPYDDFYPRMGFLAVGDRFTTNAVKCESTTEVGDMVYVGTDGYWTTDTATVGPVCQIVEDTTCPNGVDRAFKLMVVKA